jgi:hypothetical protein
MSLTHIGSMTTDEMVLMLLCGSHNNFQYVPLILNGFELFFQPDPQPNAIASSSQTIGPTLIAIPSDHDGDLSDGPTIAKAQGCFAAKKVAGVHQKGKGKKKEGTSKGKGHALPVNAQKCRQISDDKDVLDDGLKRGYPCGAGNYMSKDVTALLDLVEKELPLGQCGWQSIHCHFTQWACLNGRLERLVKSLETKYKQVCSYVLLNHIYSLMILSSAG